jgi:rhodanese-related sulfurtransferase
MAAATLQRLGVAHATDMVGGFEAWAGAGLPIEPLDRAIE